MKTYIWTCDKLVNQTMEMVDYFFPKYWPEANVVVLGYQPPTYQSKFASFDSMGTDLGPEAICEQLYEYFSTKLQDMDINCKMGVFGGDMEVSLINDGPTTIWLDNKD